MGLFKRFTNVVASNLNELISRSEDPRKVLEQAILDMQEEQKKAQKKRLEVATLQKTTEKQLEAQRARAQDMERKAMAALKMGDEALARRALEEKEQAEAMVAELQHTADQQKGMVEELTESLKAMDGEVANFKKKRDELMARLTKAEMKQRQAETQTREPGKDHIGDTTAFDTFDRMVEKIEGKEAEVEAMRELAGEPGDTAEVDINKLLSSGKTDDALEALKRKMGKS
ncbi:MAG: PspA/IM30 family protein [Myxococcota bacterium]